LRRAIEGGLRTIEHADHGTYEQFLRMKEKGIAFCPTISCTEVYEECGGWRKGVGKFFFIFLFFYFFFELIFSFPILFSFSRSRYRTRYFSSPFHLLILALFGIPDKDTKVIIQKKASFQAALKSGVTILCGGDVGVFAHGENARELELMVEYQLIY
jgi:hypothetical protein